MNSIGKYRKTTRNSPACSTVSHPALTQSKGWGLRLFTFSLSPLSCFSDSGCNQNLKKKKIIKITQTGQISTNHLVISISSKHAGKEGFSSCYNWFLVIWEIFPTCTIYKTQVTKISLKYFHFQIIQSLKHRNLLNSIPLFGSIMQIKILFVYKHLQHHPSLLLNLKIMHRNNTEKHTHFIFCKYSLHSY